KKKIKKDDEVEKEIVEVMRGSEVVKEVKLVKKGKEAIKETKSKEIKEDLISSAEKNAVNDTGNDAEGKKRKNPEEPVKPITAVKRRKMTPTVVECLNGRYFNIYSKYRAAGILPCTFTPNGLEVLLILETRKGQVSWSMLGGKVEP